MRHGRRWLRAVAFAERHNRRMPRDAPRASFYPMRLGQESALAQVLPRLGLRIGSFGEPAALTFAWHTGTG